MKEKLKCFFQIHSKDISDRQYTMASTLPTNKYSQWRQTLREKYELSSVRNEEIKEHTDVLQHLKTEVNDKMQTIHKEREKDMKILKHEVSVKLSNYSKELERLKTEIEEKKREWKNKRASFIYHSFSSSSFSRNKKRKFSEIEQE